MEKVWETLSHNQEWILHVWSCRLLSREIKANPSEVADHRWVTPQEAAQESWEKSRFEWRVTYSSLFLGLSIVADSLLSGLSSINFGSLGDLLFGGSEALRKAKKLVEESKPVVSGNPNFKITDNI